MKSAGLGFDIFAHRQNWSEANFDLFPEDPPLVDLEETNENPLKTTKIDTTATRTLYNTQHREPKLHQKNTHHKGTTQDHRRPET